MEEELNKQTMPLISQAKYQPSKRQEELFNRVHEWYESNSSFIDLMKEIERKANDKNIGLKLTRFGFHILAESRGLRGGAPFCYELFYDVTLFNNEKEVIVSLKVDEWHFGVIQTSFAHSSFLSLIESEFIYRDTRIEKSPSIEEFMDAKFRIDEEINTTPQD